MLLPVRNGLPWLGAAVASIWQQTLDDLELIVLEDGSTDGTPDLLKTVCDDRLRLISTGGVGIARALNIGLEAARGTYIARQDADDESLPARLARQVELLETRPDIGVVATIAQYIDADGQPLDNDWVRTIRRQHDLAVTPAAIARLMPLTCCVTHGSVMARAGVLKASGGYRPEFVPADDYDLWLRLLPSCKFAKVDEPLYRYRIHPAQLGAQSGATQTSNAILAKLLHVRRAFPHLEEPARLAVLGATRGDDLYRSVASQAGFHIVPTQSPWDVLAITDLARVQEYERRLALKGHAGFETVGNFFVRVPAGEQRMSA